VDGVENPAGSVISPRAITSVARSSDRLDGGAAGVGLQGPDVRLAFAGRPPFHSVEHARLQVEGDDLAAGRDRIGERQGDPPGVASDVQDPLARTGRQQAEYRLRATTSRSSPSAEPRRTKRSRRRTRRRAGRGVAKRGGRRKAA